MIDPRFKRETFNTPSKSTSTVAARFTIELAHLILQPRSDYSDNGDIKQFLVLFTHIGRRQGKPDIVVYPKIKSLASSPNGTILRKKWRI